MSPAHGLRATVCAIAYFGDPGKNKDTHSSLAKKPALSGDTINIRNVMTKLIKSLLITLGVCLALNNAPTLTAHGGGGGRGGGGGGRGGGRGDGHDGGRRGDRYGNGGWDDGGAFIGGLAAGTVIGAAEDGYDTDDEYYE